jgi:TolB-like protein
LTDVLSSQCRKCVDKILSSSQFSSSPRQRELLRYLARYSFGDEKKAGSLKGYVVGVEVFGRGENFDPATDSIVRVEAGRLRARLLSYYAEEGRDDALRIDIPKGGYSLVCKPMPPANVAEQNPKESLPPTLAILPFADPRGDIDGDYFADGVADSMIHEFSRLSGVRVISRHSSFAYRNSNKGTRDIGRELGADHLLMGSVQRAAGRVRVTVQLVDAGSDVQLWSDRCEANLEELFSLQDQLTLGIVRALQIRLAPAEAKLFGYSRTVSVEAQDAFLRGLSAYWKAAPPFVQEAREHFARAIAADPGYAAAKAWLAQSALHLWIMNVTAPDVLRDEALRLAEEAVALDGDLPFAVSTLGWVLIWFKRSAEAIQLCRRAVAMDPGNAELIVRLSMALSFSGEGEESLDCAQRALQLTPLSSPVYQFALAAAFLMREDYDNAIVALKRGREIEPHFLPNVVQLALIYALLDMDDEIVPLRNFLLQQVGGSAAHYLRHPWTDPKIETFYADLVRKAGFP